MQFTLFVCSAIVSCFIIYITQRVFLSRGITDKIKNRSSHIAIATRSGGISIFLGVFFISFFNYLTIVDIFNYSLLLPLVILMSIGLYDDIYDVDFKLKFIFQIIAAKLIIDSGLIVDNFHGILNIYEINRLLAHLVTIFIIVAIINSINFIDGIDGLAISVVSLFIILFESLSSGINPFNNLSYILLGSFIPLLIFNFKSKNKVFLGDSGSLFFGGSS